AALADPGKNAAIADYVQRIDKAEQWARTHQAQWAKLYAQETGIPSAVATAAVPRLVLRPITLDGSVVTAEQKLADAFTAAGQLPGAVDVKQFVDSRYNNLIAPLTRSN
ncbi:MAG TPA: ABC transporter substrate-binding protein, partial [Pseudonocardiaceae bacterium]|nr:ABC transporter substrate-binding protein [Pseudonocardiaceae bacterium]